MKIFEVLSFKDEYVDCVNKLLSQLGDNLTPISNGDLREIIEDKNSHLFFAENDSQGIIGMTTIGIYTSPTGKKGWIEDVVIDISERGKGVSKIMIQHILDFAKENKIKAVMLTSNPKRVAANNLYQSIGFSIKGTNLYQYKFL